VCSSRRGDACPAARHFAEKANAAGLRTTILEQDLSHGQINQQLGVPGPYTDSVDRWINSIL
jgi:arylformamidase